MATLLARISNPIVWRWPGYASQKLFGFALAEHGSMLDLCAAARLTASPARRAAYIRHALDERRHASMFSLRSTEIRKEAGKETLGYPNADTERLFEGLGEIRFLAFVHRGETRGRAQFEIYRDWFRKQSDTRNRAFFDGIIRDERRHESYTRVLLVELAGSEGARKELRRAAVWEAWRTWRRVGRYMAERIYFLAMTALYVCLAPAALLVSLSRPVRKGWITPTQPRAPMTRSAVFREQR